MADSKATIASRRGNQPESRGWLDTPVSAEKPQEEQDSPAPLSNIPTLVPGGGDAEEESNRDKTNKRTNMKLFLRAGQQTAWRILAHSCVNFLLVFVPVGIIVRFVPDIHGGVIFATNCVAIIPLAGLMAFATESVAREVGDALGALMNVTLGNSVELIIFYQNKIRIVQASILGSILANVLLILGMAFFLGGMRYREQLYNNTVTQMSACLLSLSVISLVLPTAFHAAFRNTHVADALSLRISRGTSVILLVVYIIFLVFQLKSHAYLYKSTPRHIVDAEALPGPAAAWLEVGHSGGSSDSRYDSGGSDHSLDSIRAKVGRGIRDMAAKRASTRRKAALAKSNGPLGSDVQDFGVGSSSRKPHSLTHMDSMETCVDGRDGAKETAKLEKVRPSASSRDDKGKKKVENNIDSVLMNEGGFSWENSTHTGNDNDKAGQNADATRPEEPYSTNKQDGENQESYDANLSPPMAKRALRSLRGSVSQITPVLFPPESSTGEPTKIQAGGGRKTRAVSLPALLINRNKNPDYGPHAPRRTEVTIDGSVDDEEDTVEEQKAGEVDEEDYLTRTPAIVLLLVSTGLVALCAEFLLGSIEEVTQSSPLSEVFIGLIVLPIVGNAAEHITSITVAMKNKMDLAIGVTVGSSIQIALCITPLVVMLGWALGKDMSLYFTLFETVCLFVSTFMTNFLVLDGRSNYMEGALLCTVYVLIALVAFFYPEAPAANDWGGGGGGTEAMGVH
ncbi:unnamed protein product [Clonostachys rhizophaga]|uniref:Sodium/calcium exchanger membrane region domain-containing protein n=1 Tax=Clonostachys rhizophaga TaxID=160324 RepID=A0A9N9VMU3_9HYPO|nr:unnamed protein product [Clonostachys rhizophaga]